MKRLEYTRKTRGSLGRTKSATEAVMILAHFARERQRLQQERTALEKRIHRIEERLGEITGTETRLVPIVQVGLQRMGSGAPVAAAAVLPVDRAAELTLRY